ncbi:dTDP-4-dehydrorhamnose 3,5-epimerase [Martelella sp. AD-3]|uniref:dTDP-4-dehydrorhamnose 3,5-epimerase n=2 Tax=Martelella sp. AD-3 TaxID=686597 RepID=UPI003527146A
MILMEFVSLAIPDVVLLTPKRFSDDRGYFSETFRENWFRNNVADVGFVQENQSLSVTRGTLRGIHFQAPGCPQGKLVRCLSGALLDVAVDLRRGSPTYGKWVSAKLTAENGCQLWIPVGFGHAFCTLLPETIVAYKVTDYYSPADDRGLAYDDPDLGIDWPFSADSLVLSEKDRKHPTLRELPDYFLYSA